MKLSMGVGTPELYIHSRSITFIHNIYEHIFFNLFVTLIIFHSIENKQRIARLGLLRGNLGSRFRKEWSDICRVPFEIIPKIN